MGLAAPAAMARSLRELRGNEVIEVTPGATDHLANQRTLLAWVRTSVQVIALGLVVIQFIATGNGGGWGHAIGIGLVALGGLVALFGGYDYVTSANDLRNGQFHSSLRMSLTVVACIALASLLLAAYAFAVR